MQVARWARREAPLVMDQQPPAINHLPDDPEGRGHWLCLKCAWTRRSRGCGSRAGWCGQLRADRLIEHALPGDGQRLANLAWRR